jgi:alpha-L-fucosidase
MVTKHLDGYPLWPTAVANPHAAPGYHSDRDLVGDLTRAVRSRGLRMGLYYAGGIDWTFTDRPIRTVLDLVAQSTLGEEHARYATAQWRELIDRHQPAVLWNDMGWPRESDPADLFRRFHDAVPDGVVNDRWFRFDDPAAGPAGTDFATFEYVLPAVAPAGPWELTRGLGRSFGFDASETAADLLSGRQLVELLVEVVSEGGNLLINVGPDGTGAIPEVQRRPLRELGAWLRTNGEAIFGSRRRATTSVLASDGRTVRFTGGGGHVFAVAPPAVTRADVVIERLRPPRAARARVLGTDEEVRWTQEGAGVRIDLPVVAGLPSVVAVPTGSAGEP